MLFVALCVQGTEEIVAEELRLLGKIDKLSFHEGLILFDYLGDIKALKDARTTDDIMFLVKKLVNISRYRGSLSEMMAQLSSVNFDKTIAVLSKFRKFPKEVVFNVSTSYNERIDYTAKEASSCIKSVIEKKKGWKFSEENSDLGFKLIIRKDVAVIAASIGQLPQHVERKVQTIPGSIRSSLAEVLITLSGVKKDETFLDPLCGSGIIPIEASLLGARCIAGDIDEKIIVIAKTNAGIKKAGVDFRVWDAKKISVESNSVDRVVSNLPMDKQVKISDAKVFFTEIIKEFDRVSKDSSRWVLMTRQPEQLKDCIAKISGLTLSKTLKITNSGLESEIIVVNKNR